MQGYTSLTKTTTFFRLPYLLGFYVFIFSFPLDVLEINKLVRLIIIDAKYKTQRDSLQPISDRSCHLDAFVKSWFVSPLDRCFDELIISFP